MLVPLCRVPRNRFPLSSLLKRCYSTKDNVQDIAQKQQLYMTDPISPGSIFFLPNGTKIFNKLVQFMKLQQEHLFGFKEVITPLIYKRQLWETSGHWEKYQDDMFHVQVQDETKEDYALKPMNCPGHCIIYKKFERSYHDLPLRFSDFSPLHRNEASGALSGLTRVRKFHQDDGHIFCTPDQVENEISECLRLIDMCYTKIFKLSHDNAQPYALKLSTRPQDYIGQLDVWNHAEDILKKTLAQYGQNWSINEGDGAFYGPKIDVLVTDKNGKTHQVATIQLDFQLPQRFDLRYKDRDNTYKRPIMIHRAAFGSVERFMAMLVDSNSGKWPFWLNPRQAMVIPVNTTRQAHMDACLKLVNKLRGEENLKKDLSHPVPINGYHFNVDIDARAEPIGYRIKNAILKNYSYLIIVGDEEVKTGKLAVRTSTSRQLSYLSEQDILERFIALEQNYE